MESGSQHVLGCTLTQQIRTINHIPAGPLYFLSLPILKAFSFCIQEDSTRGIDLAERERESL